MKIENQTGFHSSGLSQHLSPELTVEQISAVLGVPDRGESFDGKATHQWYFMADGEPCAVWDYRGRRWSSSGSRDVFEALFGAAMVEQD